MSELDAIGILLQFGFAGVLLVFVLLVNRQFTALINAFERHIERLTSLLEKCQDGDKRVAS